MAEEVDPLEQHIKEQQLLSTLDAKNAPDPFADNTTTKYQDPYHQQLLPNQQGTDVQFTGEDSGSNLDKGDVAGQDVNDHRADTDSLMDTTLKGLGRLAGGTLLKASEGFSVLGSAIGAGAINAVTGVSNLINDKDNQLDYVPLDKIINNPANDMFYGLEDMMKAALPIYKTHDWDDKSMFEQMASPKWWADEGTDVLGFALSNFIPAAGIGKLGLGAELAGALGSDLSLAEDAAGIATKGTGMFAKASALGDEVGKAGKLGEFANDVILSKSGLSNPIQFAKHVDNLAQNAYMTTSEAYFMSRDAGKSVEQQYLNQNNAKSTDELNAQQQQELNDKKAKAEQYTFWSNMAALSFVSKFETGFINKVFSHESEQAVSGLVNLAEDGTASAANADNTGINKFLNNTKAGAMVKSLPKAAFVEGIIKANVQNAIQSVATQFGYTGKEDYMRMVADKAFGNIGSADAWKAMMPNFVLGLGMGAIHGASEFTEQQHAVNAAVSNINGAKENMVNLNNVLYQKNEDGSYKVDPQTKQPVYNIPAILDYTANTKQAQDLGDLHDIFSKQGIEPVAKILKDEAFTKYALAHLEAGLGDELTAKVKALSSYKDEDLAKLGYDPIEMKDGEKVSISQKVDGLLQQTKQIQKDYDRASKTIAPFDSKFAQSKGIDPNARINEAVKNISRARTLDTLISGFESDNTAKFSTLSQTDPVIADINQRATRIDASKVALENASTQGTPITTEFRDKQLASIKQQEEQLIQTKQQNKEDLVANGYTVNDDLLPIDSDLNKLPEYSDLQSNIYAQEDAKVAKAGEINKYNRLADFKNGQQNFLEGIVDKKQSDFAVQDNKNRADAQAKDEADTYQAGDNLKYTDKDGNEKEGTVTKDIVGNSMINGEQITPDFVKNNNITKISTIQQEQAKQELGQKVLKAQIQKKIDLKTQRLQTLKTNIQGQEEELLNNLIKQEELITNKEKGIGRTSEKQLDKQITSIEDAIQRVQKVIDLSNQQKQQVEREISHLADAIGDVQNIEDSHGVLADYHGVLEDLNKEIDEQGSYRDKLNEALKTFNNLWKRFFPNKVRQLDKGRQDYVDAKTEIQLTKQEIKQVETSLNDLIALKNDFQNRINYLENDIKEYELAMASADTVTKAPETKISNDNPETTNGEDDELKRQLSNDPRKDIISGFNTTTGNHIKALEENRDSQKRDSQKRFFKWAEQFNPNKNKGHKLLVVDIDHPEYGLGKSKDIFSEEDKQYQTKDDLKVVVQDKNGNEVLFNNRPVYTSLLKITDEQKTIGDFKWSNGEDMFRNTKSEQHAEQAIEDYRNLIKSIKDSKEPVYLPINGKSKGIKVNAPNTSAKEAFGSKMPIRVITDNQTTIGGKDYALPQGLVVAEYNNNPVNAQTRTLTPEEVKAVVGKLKDYANVRGEAGSPDALKQLSSIVFMGEGQFPLYFLKGEDKLAFGNSVISKEDLLSGKYDEQLASFLSTKNHQIDRATLAEDAVYTDIFGKKWPSYSDYLLDARSQVDETPLTFKVVPKSDDIDKPQFLSTYLQFDSPQVSTKVVTPQEETNINQVQSETVNEQPYVTISDAMDFIPKEVEIPEVSIPEASLEDRTILNELDSPLFLSPKVVDKYVPSNPEEERNNFERIIGKNVDYQTTKTLVEGDNYGAFLRNGSVIISDLATEGTSYHEAFHVVSQLYLNDKQRSELYSDWKTNNKSDLSDNEVEEKLAEEFREYMLTKQSPYKSIFSKIVNYIKSVLGLSPITVKSLFKDIADGKFKDKEPINEATKDLNSIGKAFGISTQKDVNEAMTYIMMQNLASNNFSIKDFIKFNNDILTGPDKDRFVSLYNNIFNQMITTMKSKAELQSNKDFILNQVTPYIEANKNSIAKDHIEYLKKYNIVLRGEKDAEPLPENSKVKDTLGIVDSIEFSAKSGMPNAIKLMIASLPQTTEDRMIKLNNLGLPTLSDYKRNVAILHNELAGLSSFKDQITKLSSLRERIPEFKKLMDYLGVNSDGTVQSTLSPDKFNLQAAFRQQFDKNNYNFYLQLYNGNNSYLINSNTESLKEIIKAKWKSGYIENPNAVKVADGQYVLDKNYFEKTYLGKALSGNERIKSTLSFYKDLGINFSKPELVNIDLLVDKQRALLKRMKSEDNISDIFTGNSGWLDSAINEEMRTSLDYADNQHINPEGKTVYNVSLNDYLSSVTNDLNNKGLPKHLQFDPTTGQGNPAMWNSQWGAKIQEGKKLETLILEGARVNEQGEDGKNSVSLSTADAASQQFTSIMNGKFPFLQASDKALAKGFSFGEVPKYQSIDEATKTFKGYLADELLSSFMLNVEGIGKDFPEYAKDAKDLRIFKGIFNAKEEAEYKAIINNKDLTRIQAMQAIDEFSNSPKVAEALQKKFLDIHTNENLKLIEEQGLVQKNKDGNYDLLGIPSEIAKKFIGKENDLSPTQMRSLVEQFTYNQLQSTIEQTKLFTGDPAFYSKDNFFKRMAGLVATGKTMWTGQDINEWLNKNQERKYKAKDGSIKIDKQSDGTIKSYVFGDVKTKSSYVEGYEKNLIDAGFSEEYTKDLLKSYNNYEEGDAQGYITLPEYREMLTRAAAWTSSHEAIFDKLTNGEKLVPSDFKDGVQFGYAVQKPVYFGNQRAEEINAPTYYKLSLMPLIPSVVKGTEMEELMHTMHDTGAGISVFKSGSKVANKATNSLYDENGKIKLDKNTLINQGLDYDNLKIQLDIQPETKQKVIFGTQFRKLVLANLAGKTITINGEPVEGHRIIKTYSDLISKLVSLESQKLIDKLGLTKVDDNTYAINNLKPLRDILTEEATSRSLPDNVVNGIKEVLKDGDLKPFDTLVNRNKIENILMSLVDNNIIKQKVFGDMRVQGASTGFESRSGLKGRSLADAQNSTWWSKVESDGDIKTLKFYEADKNGTKSMEVLLPAYFKEMLGQNINIRDIDPKLLETIGFRTPTQGLNSIELMKIKGFLPPEAGNLIVTPSEIVVKAGSDYDIDKLTVFFPNYTMEEGKPKYTEYKGNEDSIPAIHNRLWDIARKVVGSPENFADLITPNSSEAIKSIANEVEAMKPKESNTANNGKGSVVGWRENLQSREQNLAGKAGVGQTALHNVHHVLSQIAKLSVKSGNNIYLEHNSIGGNINSRNTIFEEEQTSGYRERTIKNASADATIAIASDFNSAGEKLTKNSVLGQGKKYIPIDFNGKVKQSDVDNIVKELNSLNKTDLFTKDEGIKLNIAGNGIYTLKGAANQDQVDEYTHELLKRVIQSPNLKVKIRSIRSGGQTGFDEAGIKAGKRLGLPTKVLAPRGYTFRNINGQDISNEKQFKQRFGEITNDTSASKIDLSQEKSVDNQGKKDSGSILDTLSAFLNSFVDMAKDPFLKSINANSDTIGTYSYLIRAGVPLRQAIMFMNQPIVSDYLEAIDRNKSLFLNATDGKDNVRNIENTIREQYKVDSKVNLVSEQNVDNYRKLVSTQALESYIKGKQDNDVQQQILTDYINYNKAATQLSDLIAATTPDTGIGGTMNAAQDIIDSYNKVKENSIFENVDKLMDETFIGSFHNAVENSIKMYKPLFFTEQNEAKQEISNVKALLDSNSFVKSDSKERLLNLAKNDLITYVLQNTVKDGNTLGTLSKELFHGNNSLPKLIAQAKLDPAIKDNLLIREMYPLISKSANKDIATPQDLSNIKTFNKKMDSVDANLVTEAYNELYKINPELADKLTKFSILQSGIANSPISYTQYIPNEHYIGITDDLLKSAKDNPNYGQFFDRFIRNNYKDNDLVPKANKNFNESTLLDKRNNPYLKVWNKKINDFMLFKNSNKVDSSGNNIFERIGKLGDGYNFKELHTDESMILSNRVNLTTKQAISGEVKFSNDKGKILNDINESELPIERKQQLQDDLAKAKTQEDLGKILKDFCI